MRPSIAFAQIAAVLVTATLVAGQGRPEAFSSLTIVTEANAIVRLDERPSVTAGSNGQVVFDRIPPGSHQVVVTKAGKRDFTRTITVAPGQTFRIEARLAEILGALEILTTPGAEISIDGVTRGKADAEGVLRVSGIKPGERRIVAQRAGFQKRETVVAVRDDLALTVSLELASVALPSAAPRISIPSFTVSRTINEGVFEGGLSVSPDGSWFASCHGTSDLVAFWDVTTGRLKAEWDLDLSLKCATSMTASRTRLAVASSNAVHVLDPETGRFVQSIPLPKSATRFNEIRGLAIDESSQRLVFSDQVGRTSMVDLQTGRPLWSVTLPLQDEFGDDVTPIAMAFSPDGRSLAVARGNGAFVLDSAVGSPKMDLAKPDTSAQGNATATWSADGKWLVAGSNRLQLWDVDGRRRGYQWFREGWGPAEARCASFSPDGRHLLLRSDGDVVTSTAPGSSPNRRKDPVIEIIDLFTGRTVSEMKSPIEISTCAITPDWRVLITGSSRYIQVWERK